MELTSQQTETDNKKDSKEDNLEKSSEGDGVGDGGSWTAEGGVALDSVAREGLSEKVASEGQPRR